MNFNITSDGILINNELENKTTENKNTENKNTENKTNMQNINNTENKTNRQNSIRNIHALIGSFSDDDTDDDLEYADQNIEYEPHINNFMNNIRNHIQTNQQPNQQTNQQSNQQTNQQTNQQQNILAPSDRPLLIRSNGTYNLNRTNSLRNASPLSSPDEIEEYEVNGIPCPLNGETIEATPIILQCSICHINQIQTVNFPCMHACFCLNCVRPAVRNSNKCPICRTDYMNVSMIYLNYQDYEPPNKKRKIDN